MTRAQLEHLLRAGGSITGCRDLVVIGSQAILGAHPEAPQDLLRSIEADIFPLDHPDKADLIDGTIGELSPFHRAFGYYAHGVGPGTAVLPTKWKTRLVRVENENTRGIVGWCLSPEDLAASKLIAGRETDINYVRTLLASRLVHENGIRPLRIELEGGVGERMIAMLARCV